MNIELPLYRQEKDNTCALACLRMVLGGFGINVEERELEVSAHLEEQGTVIDDLERLAREFRLVAEIQDASVQDLRRILADGKLAITYIDRAVFELRPGQRQRHSIRDAIIHTVIPTRITAKFVTFHDPRIPRIARKTASLFRQAYLGLGGRCVVCSKADAT
jgi:hypothetical protein